MKALRAGRFVAFAVFALTLLLSRTIAAQTRQLFIYPLKSQSQTQQDKDRYECHLWAVQQSGFDPSKAYPNNPNALDPQPYRPSQAHVLRGGARGAALGAIGGAIAGDAGKGAAVGAAVGGGAGVLRRRDERGQQNAARQASAGSSAAGAQSNYIRAMSACLEGRGYSVK
jgi:hypothetical protein